MDRLEYFRQFYHISQDDYRLLTENLKLKNYKKGTYLVTPGQVQKELYFVKSGVQMAYADTDKNTHVVAFTYFPDLCAIPGSFSFQQPSKYFLVCLTESELECISHTQLMEFFDKSKSIERLFRIMTEAVLAGVIDRHTELHAMTIEERFKTFCKRSPHLLQLVPHKYLASYLNIDATNFSKLFNHVKI